MAADPKTDQVIYEMMTERTAHHMCDSGDHYGRSYQRNQKFTLEMMKALPECDYEADCSPWPCEKNNFTIEHARVNPTINLFHWLTKRLDFEPDMQAHLEAFGNSEEMKDESWFGIVEDWLKKLNDGQHFFDENDHTIHEEHIDGTDLISVMGPDGDKHPCTVNSYNHECSLSGTIQFTLFTMTGERHSRNEQVYCALFVHGGCDVRSGYTAPKVFAVNTSSWTSILDFDQVEVSGGGRGKFENHDFVVYRWMPDGSADHEGFEHAPAKLQHTKKWPLEEFPAVYLKKDQKVPRKRGIVYVSNDKKTMYCPYTGDPITVWPWPE